MKIHHLNCGMMHPFGGKLMNRSPARATCHCLLIEHENGLILVDSGFGVEDLSNPKRLGPMTPFFRLQQNEAGTALRQIEKMGFKREDIKHIILTHLDMDHAGGITDFPEATIHIFRPEIEAAEHPKGFMERERYRKCHFDHSPKWAVYDMLSGNDWFGLECIKGLKNIPEEIILIPLTGHTRGHCGVAIKLESGWLLHAGDAYYYDLQMNNPPKAPPGIIFFQRFVNMDYKEAIVTQRKIWELANTYGNEIKLFCYHDPSEFEHLSNTKLP